MRYVYLTGLVLMIAAQWYAPVSMIMDSERTIDEGNEYKFKTRPVDPTDPFRGKYITLSFDAETYKSDDTTELKLEQYSTAYAEIGIDSGGYARVVKLLPAPPEHTPGYFPNDYLEVEFLYAYDGLATLKFPFQQFYLEESKASEAEQLYWQSRGDSSMVCYAKVKILNGDAKLVDVIVNDSSIVDVVRRINAGKEN